MSHNAEANTVPELLRKDPVEATKMKVVSSHSHLNGEEYLLVHDREAYAEVETVISEVQANSSGRSENEGPQSWTILADALRKNLRQRGWADTLGPDRLCLSKGRVAVGAHFARSTSAPYEPFADHILLYTGDIINVGIEILPVRAMARDTEGGRSLSTGIAYYEGEVYNVMRHGRNSPPVPLLIIGIAP